MGKQERVVKRENGDAAAKGLVQIQAPRGVVLVICGLGIASIAGAALAGYWVGHRSAEGGTLSEYKSSAAQATGAAASKPGFFRAKPGPWGDLECQRTLIEIPDEYLSVRLHESDQPRWFFKGYNSARLTELLANTPLSPAEKSNLLATTNWEVVANGIYLRPATETVLSLSEKARSQIYEVLAQFEENAAQEQAFHWSNDAAQDLFNNTELADPTRALLKKLSYRRGRLVLFADLPTVLRTIPSPDEKNRLEKVLSRRPTLLAKIIITPATDVDALLRYWGRPDLGKDLRPILEAAARIPGGAALSILNFLPAWPGTRLNMFPGTLRGAQFDCLWTAFNFFKQVPDAPTNEGAYWKRKLDSEYYPLTADPRYGDLVMLVKPDGTIVHSCVFIADNIVYTKNGASPTVPWVLMTIPELVEAYSTELPENQALRVSYYRSTSS